MVCAMAATTEGAFLSALSGWLPEADHALVPRLSSLVLCRVAAAAPCRQWRQRFAAFLRKQKEPCEAGQRHRRWRRPPYLINGRYSVMEHTALQPSVHAEVYCNAVETRYPDGSAEVLVMEGDFIRRPGFVLRSNERRPWIDPEQAAEDAYRELERQAKLDECSDRKSDKSDSRERSRRRARRAVRDLARSNELPFFVTFTLDGSKIDRYDPVAIVKRLNVWLDNRVRRDGLKYLLVPELHKDGAVHFHGLVNDALSRVDSGTMTMQGWKKPRRPRSKAQAALWASQGAVTVWNLPAWDFGFTTAIPLYGDREAAVGYVCKYVGKQEEKVGGRWYYSGGALVRPERVYHNVPFIPEEAPGEVFEVPGLGCRAYRYYVGKGGELYGSHGGD